LREILKGFRIAFFSGKRWPRLWTLGKGAPIRRAMVLDAAIVIRITCPAL